MDKPPRVLCVDDEPNVLEGLCLQLRRQFEVEVATSGEQALATLRTHGPFAVVLSDMRMPKMDGAALLAAVRKEAPDTTRMLLTGHADMQAAVAAVNEGQIFRFLLKPCPPELLRQSFVAAVEQHHLRVAEHVLLEQTLRGSVKALIDVLSLGNPIAFGRAARIGAAVSAIAREAQVPDTWQLEVAAKLSQLGLIILPDATLERHVRGQPLSAEEQAMVARVPAVSVELVANIPRLDAVRTLIAYCSAADVARAARELPVPLRKMAHVLRVAVDYERFESAGVSPKESLEHLKARVGHYDPAVLEALARWKAASAEARVKEIPLLGIAVGMLLVDDVCTTKGMLLVGRGNELTSSSVERLLNFERGAIREPLRVIDRRAQALSSTPAR